MKQKRLGPMILVVPDTQVKPGVPIDHLRALGNYVKDKKPDVIVHLGDHFDLPSLSSYDVGKAAAEGKRLADDLSFGRDAMAKFVKPFAGIRSYKPRMEFTMGNHEVRLDREAENNPRLIGTVSTKSLCLEEFGWHVNPFLKIIKIEGVELVHYVTTGVLGRPASSAAAMLRQRHCSVIQGHVQKCDVAFHPSTRQTAIMAGTFYQHQEVYLGPQGNDCYRGVWMLHQVHQGVFDIMMVSLDFLLLRYA